MATLTKEAVFEWRWIDWRKIGDVRVMDDRWKGEIPRCKGSWSDKVLALTLPVGRLMLLGKLRRWEGRVEETRLLWTEDGGSSDYAAATRKQKEKRKKKKQKNRENWQSRRSAEPEEKHICFFKKDSRR